MCMNKNVTLILNERDASGLANQFIVIINKFIYICRYVSESVGVERELAWNDFYTNRKL